MNISPNFSFLKPHNFQLVNLGTLAEQYFQTDPITCLMKLRQFGESLAQLIAAENGIYTDEAEDQFKLINRLSDHNIISDKVETFFNQIRKAGNKATHNQKGDHDLALQTIKYARLLGIWYYRVITKNKTFKPGAFIPPNNPVNQTEELKQELSKLREEAEKSRSEAELAQFQALQEKQLREIAEQLLIETEKQNEEFAQQLKEIQNQNQGNSSALIKEIILVSQEAENEIELDEYDTRFLIDSQLKECGWEVDSQYLTYGKGTRPTKRKNYAIAQYPVNDGVADYALFCGLQIVGIIEAKRQSQDVSSDIEQAKRYSESFHIKQDEILPNGSPYNNYYIPFVFATNGRQYLRQLHTKSGIWFCDLRQSNNLARPLQNWYSPAGLLALLKIDIVTSHQQLAQESFNYNIELRPYQKEAIKQVELALFQQKREILLAMATGTGKTKTALILIYRLLKNKRFNRVLFLVDRTALGEQTANVFKDEKIDRLESFANIFGLRDLDSNDQDNSNIKVHIATVQSFVEKILFLPIDEYDCIFVDECHRGYILDDELTETELSYKDQNNYISKYRRVLDYFDAVKIGLTATPALHTTQIFGDPIYQYTYRQAVIDGYLIDHEPPIILTTKLAQEGISWKQGEEIEIFKQNTGEIDLIHAPDQIEINIDHFNGLVITESFNQVICRELVNYINPSLPGKTLIFCVNNTHADLVVYLLKEALKEKYDNIDDSTVMKITGSVDQPLQKIRLYKNEANPKIAVTVDLLTTGIDVPSICNLVFLRRVNSRILYAQMLGRATRLCNEIDKQTFKIFDAVRLYEAISNFSDMKPVVKKHSDTFAELINQLSSNSDEEIQQDIIEQLLAKLQVKGRKINQKHQEQIEMLSGMSYTDMINYIQNNTPENVAEWLKNKAQIAEILDRKDNQNTSKYLISYHEDELRGVEFNYGTTNNPEEYLQQFKIFLQDNINEIPVLRKIIESPKDLTRQELNELLLRLDQDRYTELNLQVAWREITKEEIKATIIGFIRKSLLDENLISYDERINQAMNKVLSEKNWTDTQKTWLNKISNQFKREIILGRENFEEGAFKEQGGFKRINNILNGELENILGDIKENIW